MGIEEIKQNIQRLQEVSERQLRIMQIANQDNDRALFLQAEEAKQEADTLISFFTYEIEKREAEEPGELQTS